MSRPTKLTPELQRQITEYISAGNYTNTACQAVGIAESTYYKWKELGEAGRRPYMEFMESIKKAEAQAEISYIKVIQEAASEHWQAAAWYLERKHYSRWGKKTSFDVENIDRPIIIDDIGFIDSLKATAQEAWKDEADLDYNIPKEVSI